MIYLEASSFMSWGRWYNRSRDGLYLLNDQDKPHAGLEYLRKNSSC